VGIDDLAETARMFGLGQSTGMIMFPRDQAGLVPDREWKQRNFKGYDQRWYPMETLDVAIGQGAVLVTPLQLANMYSAIAERGTLLRPMIVKSRNWFRAQSNAGVSTDGNEQPIHIC